MRRLLVFAMRVAALVVGWVLAWGGWSPLKVLSGIVLACAVLLAFPARAHDPQRLRLSVVGMAQLAGYVMWQLVVSNVLVAREIVTPGSKVRAGVLAHRLDDVDPQVSDVTMSLLANIIALTPGTMTVELTREPNVIYVHVLLLEDVDEARASIAHLQLLVSRALYGKAATKRDEAHP